MRPKAAVLAAGLTVTALLAAAACTGPPDGPVESVSGPGGTQAALRRAALDAGDVPGYRISGDTPPGDTQGTPRADRPACAPLAEVMGERPDDRARATVSRGLGSQRTPGLAVSASLSAYSAPDAHRLMTGLRTALARCGTGFATLLDGRRAAYREVREVPYAVRGDESVGWTASALAQGAPAPVHIVVVRLGATVVRFMAIDLSGRAPSTVTVPHEIADRQLDKLARTLGG
ncbi:hypothetical protein ACFYZ9_15830 [Streptomyces sp. NPDC001691]|uniref:hypothetical protein n=1 Tax=unclassified Streptomyces TaxID=2593676 RepID=UPI000DEA99A8|nr:hypothetical protein [Streptomyces sp. SDr-06]RCH68018.1 hypothetical protein DT019_13540 [Streptomyces sp. SDr-06]